MKPSTEWWRYLAPLAVIAIIALLPVPAGLENHTWLYFAVFTGVIVGLILKPVPGAVVAMVGISIIAILSPWLLFSPEQLAQPGFKFTAKSLSWAVSGFSNSVIWLIFAAFMFGTGYEKTGLGRRIALILVKKMGHRTLFLGYAVMFSELIFAPVTPSNSARGAGIIYPIIRNLPPLYQSQPNDSSSRSIGSYIMWMGIVADCVTSAIFLTAMAPNLLLIGLMKSASHATLSWGDWFLGMLPLSILLVLLVPWLAYVLYPPVLKSGDQVPRWAETELQAMGPLCSREKRMLGLMVGALVLWIFGGDYIDAAMVGYSVVALMLLLRIISWDDIVSNKAAWNVFFWLASLITLATGLNNTGFISWWQTVSRQLKRLFANDGDGGVDCGVLSTALLFRQRHGVYLRSRTDDDCRCAGDAGNPAAGVLPDGWCGNWSGEHSYTIRHRPQSDLLRQWLSANGGLLATGGDFWADIPRIAGDYRLTVDARGVALSEDGAGNCSPAPNSFTQPVTPPAASADAR